MLVLVTVRALAAPVVAALVLVASWPDTFHLFCGDTCEQSEVRSRFGVPLPTGLAGPVLAVGAAVLLAAVARVVAGPLPRPGVGRLVLARVVLPLTLATLALGALYPVELTLDCPDSPGAVECLTSGRSTAGLVVPYETSWLLLAGGLVAVAASAVAAVVRARRRHVHPAADRGPAQPHDDPGRCAQEHGWRRGDSNP